MLLGRTHDDDDDLLHDILEFERIERERRELFGSRSRSFMSPSFSERSLPATMTRVENVNSNHGTDRRQPLPSINQHGERKCYNVQCGLAGKAEWARLDDALWPLIKKTLYLRGNIVNDYLYGSAAARAAGIPVVADTSDACHVDNAFELLTSAELELETPTCALTSFSPRGEGHHRGLDLPIQASSQHLRSSKTGEGTPALCCQGPAAVMMPSLGIQVHMAYLDVTLETPTRRLEYQEGSSRQPTPLDPLGGRSNQAQQPRTLYRRSPAGGTRRPPGEALVSVNDSLLPAFPGPVTNACWCHQRVLAAWDHPTSLGPAAPGRPGVRRTSCQGPAAPR
ncbi:hypothetical protein MTO96_042878 [Rhipicephalus appendiculatus]